MKKVIAYISLMLIAGYAGSILLKTYTQAGNGCYSDKTNAACCIPMNAAEFADTSSDSKYSTHQFFSFNALTTSIGKIKLPSVSSCPVITATFTILPGEVVFNAAVTDPAQLHTPPAPIFLQNGVLRL